MIMTFHLLALIKWLMRSMFGVLSTDGDATGESTADKSTANGPLTPAAASAAETLDHPPLDNVKVMCAAAWPEFPVKFGAHPLRVEQGKYFYPCKDLSNINGGNVLDTALQ